MPVYAGETARFEASLQDSDGLPTCPLPETMTVEVKSEDEATTLQAALAMRLVVEDKGSLTAATATTLTDSSQAWTVDQWKGAVVRIASGNALGAERRVKSNTATVLTLDTKQVVNEAPIGPLTTVPVATDQYELHRSTYRKNWDVPAAQEDKDLVAIFRATVTGANPYKAVEKRPFTAEAKSV